MADSQKLIIIGVVGVVVAGILGYVIWRTSGVIKKARTDAEAAEQQAQKIKREKVDKIPQKVDTVLEKRPMWAELNMALPAAIDTSELDIIINYAQDQANLGVDKFDPVKESKTMRTGQKTSKLKNLSTQLTCSGTYFDLIRFLNIFETQRQFFNFTEFGITPETKRPGVLNVRRLVLNMYTYDLDVEEDLEALMPQLEKYKQTKDVKVLLERPRAEIPGGEDAK